MVFNFKPKTNTVKAEKKAVVAPSAVKNTASAPAKATPQPPKGKAVTRVNSLRDLAKLPEFKSTRKTGIIAAVRQHDKALVVGSKFARLVVDAKGNKSLSSVPVPTIIIPADVLTPGLIPGVNVSYDLVKNEEGRNVPSNYRVESNLAIGFGSRNYAAQAEEVLVITEAELLMVANGCYKVKEYNDMNETEQADYVTSALETMFGTEIFAYKNRGIVYYSFPIANLNDYVKCIFADKLNADSTVATSATTNNAATRTATNDTTVATAPVTGLTADTTVTTVAA